MQIFKNNHWALILGGSSGFGLASAKKLSQQPQTLSCSIGIYSRIPTTQHTLHDYFIEADKALYQAKNSNKGSFKLLSNWSTRNKLFGHKIMINSTQLITSRIDGTIQLSIVVDRGPILADLNDVRPLIDTDQLFVHSE